MARRRVRYEADGPEEKGPEESASSVYARGQTVIPKAVREALRIEYGTRLHWEVREGVIHVMPMPKQPVQALRGILKGTGLTYAQFAQERARERAQERKLEAQWERAHRPAKKRAP